MSPLPTRLITLAAAALAAGCSIAPQVPTDSRVFEQERFATDAPFSRAVNASPETACDGARRVLLGQGYALHQSEPARLQARKFFRPAHGTGVELAMAITCLSSGAAPNTTTTVYVVAWQDEFITKRSAVSASVGLPVMGNVSMPVATTEDTLVKVGVETVQDRAFYERFFVRLQGTLAP
jgi:hypothetical protein